MTTIRLAPHFIAALDAQEAVFAAIAAAHPGFEEHFIHEYIESCDDANATATPEDFAMWVMFYAIVPRPARAMRARDVECGA